MFNPPIVPEAATHDPTPLASAVSTYPFVVPLLGRVKPVSRTVPLTSKATPGVKEPIPTLPLATIKLPPLAVHVPMPTFPFVMAKAVCGTVVPIPTLLVKVAEVVAAVKAVLPVKVFAPVPFWVIPVVAVIAPALLTVNAFAPTANAEFGAKVPKPTLPLITTKAPCGVAVPIPTLAPLVVLIPTLPLLALKILVPDRFHPLDDPVDDQVVLPRVSVAVNTYPLLGVPPLMFKNVALMVPFTSKALPGHAEPIPTLPPPLTIKLPPAAVHVPMPTFPLVTTNPP